MFAIIKVIVLHVDCLSWTGAYTLPTEKAFGYVVPYGDCNWVFSWQNLFVEALKRNLVLDEAIHWLAPFLRRFKYGAGAARSACSVPVALTVIDERKAISNVRVELVSWYKYAPFTLGSPNRKYTILATL